MLSTSGYMYIANVTVARPGRIDISLEWMMFSTIFELVPPGRDRFIQNQHPTVAATFSRK